ncbi:hypothetical protein MMPV_005708 [Pyropia vietnamensis]
MVTPPTTAAAAAAPPAAFPASTAAAPAPFRTTFVHPFAVAALGGRTAAPPGALVAAAAAEGRSGGGRAAPQSFSEVLSLATSKALRGGLPGAAAMGIQVTTLLWLRTTMNYQYRHGTTTRQALSTLYKEGGVRRFYRGFAPALVQAPLSRFGDTAANAGMIALLDTASETTANLPVIAKTSAASAAAAGFRIFLMPVDAVKTSLQVNGASGLRLLLTKARTGGVPVFYHGALGAAAATYVGHFPWFSVYNSLNASMPTYEDLPHKVARNAFIGFSASVVSDCCSNSLRVVKTYRQTHAEVVSYPSAVRQVVAQDGVVGLFGRGLQTRIIANGFQGLLFTVLWKLLEEQFTKRLDRK